MKDETCICFLQWALPHLQMRWPGFRKVRGQVCKRLARRLKELQLDNLKSYQMYLQDNPLEWQTLDSLCRITISRFYRDKGIYESLRTQILPELAQNAVLHNAKEISCWCIGTASGEEPFSISILWDMSGIDNQGIDLAILATEVDQRMISRAGKGCYPESSIRELPAGMEKQAFTRENEHFCIKEQYKKRVQFLQQDIRNAQPDTTFDLIFCRNLVFTYFSKDLQTEITQQILQHLNPGGYLVIGTHEDLPGPIPELFPWRKGKKVYRKKI